MIYKFSDLFKWTSGKSISPSDGNIPLYGSNGIIGYTNSAKYENKIILGRVGAYCGSVAYCSGKFNATDNTLITSCVENRILTLYAYYLLKSFNLNNFAGGAAQPLITQSILKRLKCDVPSLSQQCRIASILSTYDSLIENNTKRIRLLEKMAENLYKEWFVRFRFPGHEKVKMENGLPKGWSVVKLGSLANISTGKCNREDAEEDGVYPLFDRSQDTKRSSKWLKDCEAIIVPGEGTSFMPRYYVGKFNLHQRCYCVEPLVSQMGKFLFYTIMFYRAYFLSVATGATVPSLRYNNFAYMKITLPTKDLYTKFDKVVSGWFAEKDNLQQQNTLLARQRDLLLPRLMSSKLEV